ncbi:hypothetical protein [Roseateles chitosanitabidus]|uniref:hypothetical protein n=1 Tax=Roseateles chitosanitabidus TaxID=65048 RepID=UPI000836CFD4|nr:hypothetical protein [Roseateles chitosanitabidus]
MNHHEIPLFPPRRFQPQRLLIAATLGCALMAGVMSVALAEPAAPAAVTRDQVVADLKAYQDSGLAALESDESQSEIGTPAWRAARVRYLALRGIPADGVAKAPLTRAQVLTDLKLYQQSGLADAERRDGEESNQSASLLAAQERYDHLTMMDMMDRPLTRAEVLADLQVYRESGLAAYDRSEGDVSRSSPGYQQALARYKQLRRDGHYQHLVMALGKSS